MIKLCKWSRLDDIVRTSCGNQIKFSDVSEVVRERMKLCIFCGEIFVDHMDEEKDEYLDLNISESLPKPETEYPKDDQVFYYLTGERLCGYIEARWIKSQIYIRLLNNGVVHLTKDRVEKWTNLWKKHIINGVNKGDNKNENNSSQMDSGGRLGI